MTYAKELGERIKRARGNLSQAEFAERIGVHKNTFGFYERGERVPDAEAVRAICDSFGVTSAWLLFGVEPVYDPERTHEEHARAGTMRAGEPLSKIVVDRPLSLQEESPSTDLVMVPKVRARLSAGNGSLETSNEVKARYAFRREWIAGKGQPGKMVLMDVTGDSMEPAILARDVVLIDQGQADIIPGAIYAVGIDEGVVVKYVDRVPGKLILRSANKDYLPIEVDLKDESQNVRIIGRVVWWCREAR